MASFTAYASKMKAEGLSDAAITAFNLLKQVVRLDTVYFWRCCDFFCPLPAL